MSFLRKMFSGKASAEDPRRYVIEAMLGAMEADGDLQDEEVTTFEGNLAGNTLFEGLTPEELSRLTDQAADAIREAGGGKKRLPEIAKHLPSRQQRLSAYALACEICVADKQLQESEIDFLESMQEAFGLAEGEAKEVFEAARKHSGLLTLEEKTEKMKTLMPKFVQCMALMAAADGEVHHEERLSMRNVLKKIPDMAVLVPGDLDKAMDAAFDAAVGKDAPTELAQIAKVIENVNDRYWTAVYVMIIALADGKTDWREVKYLDALRKSFALTEEQMDAAITTARQFPAVDLGGDAP